MDITSNDDNAGSISPFKVYTLQEAADLLRVDRKAVYRLQDEGKLPRKKLGKGYKFLGEDLLRAAGSAVYSAEALKSK